MKKKIAQIKCQQGDVVLTRVESLPAGTAKIISKRHCILAEGEATGHAHVIEESEAELIQIGERILLKLTKSATVVHQEHKPIMLSPGIWEIGRIKEFDYYSKMARPVQD